MATIRADERYAMSDIIVTLLRAAVHAMQFIRC